MTFRVGLLLLVAVMVSSCARKPDLTQPHVAFADKFAHAVAEGRFDEAHSMLTNEQKKVMPAAQLKKEYEEMIAYGPGPAKQVEPMQALGLWPDKKRGDVGWVYVAIAGDSFSEAVAVVVTRVGDRLAIRSVEWGRP